MNIKNASKISFAFFLEGETVSMPVRSLRSATVVYLGIDFKNRLDFKNITNIISLINFVNWREKFSNFNFILLPNRLVYLIFN